MTFGTMAAWQAGLLLAAAGVIAVWLFRLKVRPPRVILPSLLLWRRVFDETREVTLWERIRRAVSLVVTLAIALALALALTRPWRTAGGPAIARGRTLIVIDSSLSMLARTRTGETRWMRALAEARSIAAASGGDVLLATTAEGVVEGPRTDAALVETALDRIVPSGEEAASWPSSAGADSVHFITDGAVARTSGLGPRTLGLEPRTSGLEPRPSDFGPRSSARRVTVHSVFEEAGNVAITAFDVRPSLASGHAGEAYLEVANYAATAQAVHVTISRGRSEVLDRRFDMRAGEALRQVVPLASGGDATLRARIDAPTDALDVDNEAVAWIEHARPLEVIVVGQRTSWLAGLLARDPLVRATFVDTSSAARLDRADVVIFDRWMPRDPPNYPALYFAPPLETVAEELRPIWSTAGTHPVVTGVDPFTLTIDKARGYRLPELSVVSQSARGTPLVYAGGSKKYRTVVVTFGATESNLASAPAFPVLIGNALDWLGRVSSVRSRRPGPMTFDDTIVSVTDSRGAMVPLTRVDRVAVGVLAPGLYIADGAGGRTAIAVNAGDAQVSNLLRTTLTGEDRARRVAGGASSRPWWMYCAIVAFVLAMAEWWTWQRRITV